LILRAASGDDTKGVQPIVGITRARKMAQDRTNGRHSRRLKNRPDSARRVHVVLGRCAPLVMGYLRKHLLYR